MSFRFDDPPRLDRGTPVVLTEDLLVCARPRVVIDSGTPGTVLSHFDHETVIVQFGLNAAQIILDRDMLETNW